MTVRRLLLLAGGLVALGPIATLMTLRAARSRRRGDRVLPWLYLAAIPCSYVLLSAIAAWLGAAAQAAAAST